jgi:hypothetical protein
MNSNLVTIPCFNSFDMQSSLDDISANLDVLERRAIRHAPWSGGRVQPEASFALAYSSNEIFLKYYVKEHFLKAEYLNFNDPVFEDSCVEFFIAFDNDVNYYNLEFNCIGNCRVQYGQHKTGRTFIAANLLKTIRHQTLVKCVEKGNVKWELTLSIPRRIFMYHPGLSFEWSEAKINVFKCGDGLPEPHFLCWSEVESQWPEFHISKFFKEITFGRQSELTEHISLCN